jgi:hypothetical protein
MRTAQKQTALVGCVAAKMLTILSALKHLFFLHHDMARFAG